jgi:hypothetical protein
MGRPCVLRKDGATEDLDGGALRYVAGQPLVLCRSLCRFERFCPPPGLSKQDQARAARLKAEEAAPFADSGITLVRQGPDVAIWHWDRAAVTVLAPGFDRERCVAVPESVVRAPGEGWRMIACLDGFEAQYWKNGTLVASNWRREVFTATQWKAFALSVGDASIDAPSAPPEMEFAPLQATGDWRSNLISAPLAWRDAERGFLGIAAAALLVATVWAGHGAHSVTNAQAARAIIEAAEESGRGSVIARDRLEYVRSFNEIVGDQSVVEIAADAFEVFKILRIEALDWKIDARRFEARVVIPEEEGSLSGLARAIEDAPGLRNVEITFAATGETDVIDISAEVASSRLEP